MVVKKTIGDYIFDTMNYLLLGLIAFICVVPIIHVIMASVSEPAMVDRATSFILHPLGKPSLNAYKIIMRYKNIWIGYNNTLIRTCTKILNPVFC